MTERFVVLGLGRPRAEWFRSVAAWATSGAVPAEFVKCVSAEELRAHLAGARSFSAALLDAGVPATDRDLLAAVRDAGVVPLVVESPGITRDWVSLGAVEVLPTQLERSHLLDALGSHATMIGWGDPLPAAAAVDQPDPAATAPVAVACGAGGTGASTVAIGLAQGLVAAAGTARPNGPSGPTDVVLADLCRHADQAMLHDARDVVPGVQELVEAHRGGGPSPADVRDHTFHVTDRGYHLLLGLRRSHHWPTLRPRSFGVAFASLRGAFDVVVCDVNADFETEAVGGSIDVEERNLMALTAVRHASVVFAVGAPDLHGLHGLVRLLGELGVAGVADERVVPVVNRAPRAPRSRAEIARTLADLAPTSGTRSSPVFLPRRRVDQALRDGVPVPEPLGSHLAGAYASVVRRNGPMGGPETSLPTLAAPGSLGTAVRRGALLGPTTREGSPDA